MRDDEIASDAFDGSRHTIALQGGVRKRKDVETFPGAATTLPVQWSNVRRILGRFSEARVDTGSFRYLPIAAPPSIIAGSVACDILDFLRRGEREAAAKLSEYVLRGGYDWITGKPFAMSLLATSYIELSYGIAWACHDDVEERARALPALKHLRQVAKFQRRIQLAGYSPEGPYWEYLYLIAANLLISIWLERIHSKLVPKRGRQLSRLRSMLSHLATLARAKGRT